MHLLCYLHVIWIKAQGSRKLSLHLLDQPFHAFLQPFTRLSTAWLNLPRSITNGWQ